MKKGNDAREAEISKKFVEIDTSDFPNFYDYKKPLEMGLWILWVVKEKLGIKRLTAEQIASVIRDAKEISCDSISITRSFNRAKSKLRTYKEGEEVYFEIMKPGKDHLISQVKKGSIEVFYFEPGKPYTSKRLLSKSILDSLKGELKIVDPYCGERTLDILKDVKNRAIRFLTKVGNLRDKDRNRLLRELQDFRLERPNIEFRNYPHADIHDRYIISSNCLVILGHSIKNLGDKESFAIVLNKDASKDIVEALIENFDRRWKQSDLL